MENGLLVFAAGVLFCFVSVTLATRVFANKNCNIFYYVFSVFAFTAMVDLDIAFTLDNVVWPWVEFYLKEGEPYLCSSYGSAINWWDGTFHYALYVYMAWKIAANKDYRWAGFVWVGSIMNSLVVFLPGNVIGKWGAQIKESYLLNVPYVLFPLIFAVREFRKKSPSATLQGKEPVSRGFFLTIIDYILSAWLVFAIGLAFFRAFVVLQSPRNWTNWWISEYEPILSCEGRWPMLQILAHVYFFVPFYICALQSLYSPRGKTWFPDWAAIHAGAALQGQFSYIYPAVHQIPTFPSTYPNQEWKPVPQSGEFVFWAINLSLVVFPVLLFLRTCFVNQVYWSHTKEKSN
eukprot:TRINITY_DN13529_c0_g1_i1.p1 TRINITY_DN13529_c0_g1~~TRINITY_DN13529_c0_g1_i1.p1  ORF type:complete len:393 (-),score=48.55 TRINITY_DN13529_c0_g1_i1:55-1095(-)